MLVKLPEDKVLDFIDGNIRNKTQEEYVRQNVERSLVQEYRYKREEVAVEFAIKVGSSRKRVDLIIFPEGAKHLQNEAFALIECKKEGVSPADKKEGVEQLKSYMAVCPNVRYGLWTNGSDQRICLARQVHAGTITFAEITDIPIRGEAVRENEAPDRHQLHPASGDNLLFAFKRCHNYVAGNQGLQKPEAFWELLKVIFCKIEDERTLDALQFYITNKEQKSPTGQLKCKNRIDKLFESVRSKHSSIFKKAETIELNRAVLAYVVSQLQNISLLDSPVDVKGVAYEEIVGSNLRGDRGEFFTPRNACKMAVAMLDPEPGARIIDPSCGTGGFLITAMNRILEKLEVKKKSNWRDQLNPTATNLAELFRARQELLSTTLVGLDINPNLVRAAKMNMVMNNDGSGGLEQADSLRDSATWTPEAARLAQFGTFDYVFTNPPFGTNIKIDLPEVLEQYDLGCVWNFDESTGRWAKRIDAKGRSALQGSQPPEILFIERCLRFLKPGTGKMAMVIPNGILNSPPLGYVRQWILDNAQVLAVVDMQRDLFQPRNDTQTSMVVLRRLGEREISTPTDYPIFFAVTEKIGHDKRGRPIYVRDEEGFDVLVERQVVIKRYEKGKVVAEPLTEKVPLVDDQLALVPELFRKWASKHVVGI